MRVFFSCIPDHFGSAKQILDVIRVVQIRRATDGTDATDEKKVTSSELVGEANGPPTISGA